MTLQLKLSLKSLFFVLALAVLYFAPRPAGAETLTLTTYYPAPYGGYVSLLTTGPTFLARDADYVTVGKTGDFSDKLLVNGNIKATNNISGGNVFAGGKPVITTVVCDLPLVCTVTNNTLHISLAAAACSAPEPACGATTTGVDAFGAPCEKKGEACRYQCPNHPNDRADNFCGVNHFGETTCKGQVQFGPTCYWMHVWSKIDGCHHTQNTENCAPVN
ncbi:MAG TPA: hypothetical protein PKI19_02805 [Elusimicrobiales bacterium]|nr:hypothetical protein [Elusimicrobiales bacterium]